MLRSCVCVHCVLQGQIMHRTSLSVLGRFLFGECELLCSSVFPLQPFQCPWYQVFDMDPIKDAPRHCTHSVLGFSLISNKYLQTPLEHAAKRAVSFQGPICPHVFAIRLFVWVCSVSPLVPNPPFRSWSHPSSVRLDGGCGGGIEPHLLQSFLRRHHSSVLSNQGTFFAVRYLDGSAYAKARCKWLCSLISMGLPWFQNTGLAVQ